LRYRVISLNENKKNKIINSSHFLIHKSFFEKIGYEIGRLLKKETIFCERIKGKFTLRRGFNIKKKSKVLIIEDVITTGKSTLECVKLINKSKAKLLGFACIIDRSTKKNLKINRKIVSHLKIDVPTYKKNKLPKYIKSIPISVPGSRFTK